MKRIISMVIAALLIVAVRVTAESEAGEEEVLLPVLMYHMVKPGGVGKDSITPWEFEKDLEFIKESGYTAVTLGEVQRYKEGEGELPEKPIILTFDDGYYNTYKYVYPLLKEYEVPIVISVIVKATDMFTRRPSEHEGYAHITWGQLNEMLESGLAEVQNHSYDLHTCNRGRIGSDKKSGETEREYEEIFGEDIVKSQAMIYVMTGEIPIAYAYPYGKYSDESERVLQSHGMKATLTCEYGINKIRRGEELYRLKRICRAHGHSAESVLREAMKTVKSG